MSEFRPVFPSHAIERCAVTLVFSERVPEKAWSRLVSDTEDVVVELGLRRGQQSHGFQVDARTGQLTPTKEGVPAAFISSDNQQQLMLLPDSVIWATQQYVRWSQFKSQFTKATSDPIDRYDAFVSMSSVQLEYWDRFTWTGDWDDFDTRMLLNDQSELFSPKVLAARREWHNHIGWFEVSDDERRLWNINIDVVGVVDPNGNVRPSVGIYTMARDQALPDPGASRLFDRHGLPGRLDALHEGLKGILKELLCEDMSKKIGLN